MLRSHCPVREGAPRSCSQQRTGLAGGGPSSPGRGEGLTTNPQAAKGVVTPPPKTEPKENVFRHANTSLEKRPPPCEGFRSEGVKQGCRRRQMRTAGSELLRLQLSCHVVLLGFGRKVGCPRLDSRQLQPRVSHGGWLPRGGRWLPRATQLVVGRARAS